MLERDTPLPLSYRADLLQKVMPALRAGECCSLVGTSGVGKSNLVRFLQRPDVQRHYWGDEQVWMVLVDTNGLVFEGKPDAYAVAELMVHRLIREAERRGWGGERIAEMDARYLRMVESRNPLLAVRSLERICAQLCEAGGVRLVFLFDQFEDLWGAGDARLFLQLRHLRDEFKYRLTYLVMTRERLQRTRQSAGAGLQEVEAFWELFSSHTYGLGPCGADDANGMIDRIAARAGIAVGDGLRDVLLAASGGHAGLLRCLFWALQGAPLDARPETLLAVEGLAEECAKIWQDLQADERSALRVVAAGQPPSEMEEAALADLRLKGLVAQSPPRVFSPVFAAYTLRQPSDMAGLVVNLSLRQVWLDQRLISKLPRLEFKLLSFLASNTSRICSREEILRHLYGDHALSANDERIDALIRRLRETLGESATDPRYLVTHRGVGFQLQHARVLE